MKLCPDCGNKRCPKASNSRFKCTNSNEPNQTKQPDWENLLTKDDAMVIYPAKMGIDTTKYLITHLNRIIYDRIKPLLERIAELEALNKTYELSILNRTEYKHQKPNTIEVPFELDEDEDVTFGYEYRNFWSYCKQNNIDQTKIAKITLTMREEE